MKNKLFILILISLLIVIIFIGGFWWYLNRSNTTTETISETQAIDTIKKQFPEMKEYPSDDLPPRSIKTEKTDEGWYVAFIQEGSGRPILGVSCFLVKNDNSVTQRKYISQDSDIVGEFSAKECRVIESLEGDTGNTSCARENCHGLDIQCGSNPPDACTEIYEIGDKCLQYAQCGVQNGKCQQIQDTQFTECKSCVQKCIDANMNDSSNLFECESKCE